MAECNAAATRRCSNIAGYHGDGAMAARQPENLPVFKAKGDPGHQQAIFSN